MLDIDFLPESYKQRTAVRHTHAWRGLVAVIFAAAVGSAAVLQQRMQASTEDELTAIAAQYEASQQHSKKLAQIQAAIQKLKSQAELYAYLKHPWPKSQILVTLADHMPNEISLDELRITREALAQVAAPSASTPLGAPEPVKKLDAGEADLQRLREECDKSQVVVGLSGEVQDTAKLHQYLAALTKSGLFATAEISSIETLPGEREAGSRFSVRLTLQPSHGQPGGPAPAQHTSSVAASTVGAGS